MLSLAESYNKANIFFSFIEYELNSLLGASHLVGYISVHIRFDLERYLLSNVYEYLYIYVCKIFQTCEHASKKIPSSYFFFGGEGGGGVSRLVLIL